MLKFLNTLKEKEQIEIDGLAECKGYKNDLKK
jgi:hypothetical protein